MNPTNRTPLPLGCYNPSLVRAFPMKLIFNTLFDLNEKELKKLKPLVARINQLESEVSSWKDEDFPQQTEKFRQELQAVPDPRKALDGLLPLAFAMVREAAKRTVGMRHFDVQLMAGIVGHQGKIFEQKTGEGKTLTATLPLYLNSLAGGGVHSVTVNDFLARRDTGWNGPIYHFLGVSTAAIIHDKAVLYDPTFLDETANDVRLSHLREIPREQAYLADIVYGTNSEFGFDYLRDNMVKDLSHMVQQGHSYALIDEVDSILIDEARTPLIISAPAEEAVDRYYKFAELAKQLLPSTDYELDEKRKTATLTEIGVRKLERVLGVDNLYEKDFETLHHIENALRANAVYLKDRDYVVREGELLIVDEFTGRLMEGRRFSEGLHQALEAKEGLQIQRESRTLATVTIQNYFRMYKKLAGMTGTAKTEEEEFYKIYGLEVLVLPSNKPINRTDYSDVVYKTERAKYRAIVQDIEKCHEKGQPVLVGTTSIEKNEMLHNFLQRKNLPHQVLNAKNHLQEASIIAEAGRLGAVTLATNIAGRGVDIELGGAGPKKYEGEKWSLERVQTWQEEHDQVVALGGLHVIGTERHESRRIDNQLRGRSGRQGDPGSSRFFVSLQDDLMRIFGGEHIERIMETLKIDENVPIESSLINRTLESSQKKVEGFHFDSRKHLLDYDDTNNVQREIIYTMRQKILKALEHKEGVDIDDISFKEWMIAKLVNYRPDITELWLEKEKELGAELFYKVVQQIALETIDMLWMDTIDVLDHLRRDIGIRGYGQMDPVVEYKKEARRLFERLMHDIFATIVERIEILEVGVGDIQMSQVPRQMIFSNPEEVFQSGSLGIDDASSVTSAPVTVKREGEKIGRNDPCPCGSGKKYKKCHGK